MKLYHIVQWGNPEEGGNGDDTNCIVSAASFQEAVIAGEDHFQGFDKTYMHGRIHIVHELGQDNRLDGPALILIYRWIQCSANVNKIPYWVRQPSNEEWEFFED